MDAASLKNDETKLENGSQAGLPEFPRVNHIPTREVANVDNKGHQDGDILLTKADGTVRLVPTPTSSPRDPLNFPKWQKAVIVIILSLFSTFSIGGVASFSALLNVFFPLYLAPPELKTPTDVLRLVTIPSFMIGFGNFLFSLSLPVLVEGAYHWAPQNVGLVAVATVIGPALAIPYAALADKVTVYLAKCHHGRHRPEDRFIMMGPPLLLAILFTFLYGHLAASAPNGTWASLLVAYGGSYLVLVALTVSTISFVVEHVSHNPGPALVLVLGGKNILSYPISNALAPLVTTGRYMYVHSILGGLVTGWTLLAVPLYFGLPYLRALKARKAPSA